VSKGDKNRGDVVIQRNNWPECEYPGCRSMKAKGGKYCAKHKKEKKNQ